MEIKIQIPDNCELVKDENTYIVKEKKLDPPRSWDEFCEKFPVQIGEAFIESSSLIHTWDHEDAHKRVDSIDRNLCSSREEAEAFLALMQLRQLRKAWVGSWEQPDHNTIIYEFMNKDNNSDHKEDHKDNNSCFDEETIEVVLQLQEPLPFKTTDFIPEPFIPTL